MLNIFIGYDPTEAAAFKACRRSIVNHATDKQEIRITPLRLDQLRAVGLYRRETDRLASTEFTYSRFLVPRLADYRDWALYLDCDMLVRADVGELFALADPRYAVQCVKHPDYVPRETEKMGGKVQTVYPRKNWSSLMLFNTTRCWALSPDAVNEKPPAWLHRMEWARDEQIGALPPAWNWLEGSEPMPDPKLVHYTRGVPGVHPGMDGAAFSDEWKALL